MCTRFERFFSSTQARINISGINGRAVQSGQWITSKTWRGRKIKKKKLKLNPFWGARGHPANGAPSPPPDYKYNAASVPTPGMWLSWEMCLLFISFFQFGPKAGRLEIRFHITRWYVRYYKCLLCARGDVFNDKKPVIPIDVNLFLNYFFHGDVARWVHVNLLHLFVLMIS